MTTAKPQSQDFGKALQLARMSLQLTRSDFDEVASSQYLGTLEHRRQPPSLGMVEKLAGVMQVHPLMLLAMSYAVDDIDGTSTEALLGDVYMQIVSARSDLDLLTSTRSSAFNRVKDHIGKHGQRRRFVLPQQLIDQAFEDDNAAIAWFRNAGMRLVPGRLQGLPGLANIFRDRESLSG